ncbi:MAG: hypothetical protein LBB67_05690 [Oscillospiraceae bacterium]|jgi:hypothetical protein|nr:hypothetical protein [Oscillospiraceae bacterium]
MFIKLLKYEFLHTGRNLTWLLGGSAAVGGLVSILSAIKEPSIASFGGVLLLNVLLLFIAGLVQMAGLVLVLYNTNKSLFSEQGYLTFSLPVSSTQLLFSKFCGNTVWLLINTIVAAGLDVVMILNMRRLVSNIGDEMLSTLENGLAFKEQLSGMFQFASLQGVLNFGGYLLLLVLVFLILAMMVCIFVITVSHVRPFQAHAGLWMILFLLGSAVVSGSLISTIAKLVPINLSLTLMSVMGENPTVRVNLTTGIVMIGLSVGLFFATRYLLSKKISLK